MGREVRRVPVGFNHPIRKTWPGFLMPEHLHSEHCDECDGSGVNPATKVLYDDWYGHEGFAFVPAEESARYTDEQLERLLKLAGYSWCYRYNVAPDGSPAERPPWKVVGTTRRWCYSLTQDEVDTLCEEGRLNEWTSEWKETPDGMRWVRKEGVPNPTAEVVNEAMQHGMGHDAINCWICVRKRAERLGVYGKCEHCHGKGSVEKYPGQEAEAEAWEREPPPEGPWYQIWETVSEGSPVSPAFENPEDLARWMVAEGNDDSVTNGTSYESWLEFITEKQWAPSAMGIPGKGIVSGVEGVTAHE